MSGARSRARCYPTNAEHRSPTGSSNTPVSHVSDDDGKKRAETIAAIANPVGFCDDLRDLNEKSRGWTATWQRE
jgi:hypothetical protein